MCCNRQGADYLCTSFHSDRVYRGWPVLRLAFLFVPGFRKFGNVLAHYASSMHRITALLITALLYSVSRLDAQPLTAYTNIQNQVMVWDNGILRKIDYLP